MMFVLSCIHVNHLCILYVYYFLVVVHRGPHGRLAFFFLLNVLPSENKDYDYYYYYFSIFEGRFRQVLMYYEMYILYCRCLKPFTSILWLRFYFSIFEGRFRQVLMYYEMYILYCRCL